MKKLLVLLLTSITISCGSSSSSETSATPQGALIWLTATNNNSVPINKMANPYFVMLQGEQKKVNNQVQCAEIANANSDLAYEKVDQFSLIPFKIDTNIKTAPYALYINPTKEQLLAPLVGKINLNPCWIVRICDSRKGVDENCDQLSLNATSVNDTSENFLVADDIDILVSSQLQSNQSIKVQVQ